MSPNTLPVVGVAHAARPRQCLPLESARAGAVLHRGRDGDRRRSGAAFDARSEARDRRRCAVVAGEAPARDGAFRGGRQVQGKRSRAVTWFGRTTVQWRRSRVATSLIDNRSAEAITELSTDLNGRAQ